MRKRNKGFTLIELLAVIVILALIALIAMPIILNIIKDAKRSAAKDSEYGYIDAVEKYIVLAKAKTGDYKLELVPTEDKELTCETKEDTKNYKFYENGIVVYYNPETGKKCSKEEAKSTTGTKGGCMKWYAFNDDDKSSTVNVILDHNTTVKVAWNSTGNNSEMKEAKEALKTDTSNWKSDLNPRLITANEIAKITEHPTFDARKTGQSSFYFDSNNQTQKANASNKSKYAWLFDYTYDCTSYGCNKSNSSTYGYWTSTRKIDGSAYVWRVTKFGNLYNGDVTTIVNGIRPVITISKSNIS